MQKGIGGSYGSPPLGDVRNDEDGTFRTSFAIPEEIGGYQGEGGGEVVPGPYYFATKPAAQCEVDFEVTED
jgi:hypothetical protein